MQAAKHQLKVAIRHLQHASQVKKILSDIDPSGGDVSVLAAVEGSHVWLDWVMPNLKSKAAGTLKSYLTSLQKFMEFVMKKDPACTFP